jgi:hypothetical protein
LVSKDFWTSIKKKSNFNENFEKKIDSLSDVNYFKEIRNPLNKEDVHKIHDIVVTRNKFYKKQNEQDHFHEIYNIKTLKTFAFA